MQLVSLPHTVSDSDPLRYGIIRLCAVACLTLGMMIGGLGFFFSPIMAQDEGGGSAANTSANTSGAGSAASSGNTGRRSGNSANDLRGLTLDIFRTIASGEQPEVAADRLQRLVSSYRFSCIRVTDYQIFSLRQNMAVLKVKCSGAPIYGVTVASNGYRAIYGGDGIVTTFDPADGPVLAFDARGDEVEQLGPTAQEVIEKTRDRVNIGNDYGFAYLGMAMVGIAVFAGLGSILWLNAWRKSKKGGRRSSMQAGRRGISRSTSRTKMVRPQGLKPLKKTSGIDSPVKDYVQSQSRLIAAHLYRHPDGFFIARGPKGRRRLFHNRLGGDLYRLFNWRLFEMKKLADSYTAAYEAEHGVISDTYPESSPEAP